MAIGIIKKLQIAKLWEDTYDSKKAINIAVGLHPQNKYTVKRIISKGFYRPCKNCGKPVPYDNWVNYDKPSCRNAVKNREHREAWRFLRESKHIKVVCPQCGEEGTLTETYEKNKVTGKVRHHNWTIEHRKWHKII